MKSKQNKTTQYLVKTRFWLDLCVKEKAMKSKRNKATQYSSSLVQYH